MTPPPHSDHPGYAFAAPLYWKAGWRSILPLPPRAKSKPPTGYTGKRHNTDPSYADITTWTELHPDGNTCLRLPDDIVGIDIDNYGAKTGGKAFIEAQQRWGELPPTIRSTSRTDGISGIRLYRTPTGLHFIESIAFPELGIGDIEIIQRGHRYAIVWPSIHNEGRHYRWLTHNLQPVTDIPTPNDLPPLPDTWLHALQEHTTTLTPTGGGEHYNIRDALTGGQPSPRVAERLRQGIKELNLPGQSRHITTRGHALALLRLGKSGEPGTRTALTTLGETFVALVAGDRGGGENEARTEFKNMVTGRGAAAQLAIPGLTDWIQHISGNASDEPDQPPPTSALVVADIENGFWEARESLRIIFTAALARMCAPWAVLAHCAARALALTRPNATLPALIGGPGSLNWFGAIAAPSGGGKGSATSTARDLIREPLTIRNLGSGEGIIGAFQHNTDEGPQTRESVMFLADEIDTLDALSVRSGSTTMSVLRSAFCGETLGFSYISRGRDIHINAHTYRMTLLISVQPSRASTLMGDHQGGTPQRFQWFPGIDRRITAEPPWMPGPLTLPPAAIWQYPRELPIPDCARTIILQERVKAATGETNTIDGHTMFIREKFAYALTLLDGRTEMTVEDWELAGIAIDISSVTRGWVTGQLARSQEEDAQTRGRLLGVTYAASDDQRVVQVAKRDRRIQDLVLTRLKEAGPTTLGTLRRAMTSRDRPWVETAVAALTQAGLIRFEGEKWCVS
jgi:hypothetical protein